MREEISQSEILGVIQAKRRMIDNFRQTSSDILIEVFGIPRFITHAAFAGEQNTDIGAVTRAISTGYSEWFSSASAEEKISARIDQILYQAESLSTAFWADRFALALEEEFGVDVSVGYEAMETPSARGIRWTDLVRDAATCRVMELTAEPELCP